MDLLKENLQNIREKIRKISSTPNQVKLIAVSKTKPVEMLVQAFQYGQYRFGENKVQEAKKKKMKKYLTILNGI